MITLVLFDKEITIHTHDVDGEQLYRAQDFLIKGAGFTSGKASERLKDWRKHELHYLTYEFQQGKFPPIKEKDDDNQQLTGVVARIGRYGGTYLNKDMVFKLAAYVDKKFYDTVFKAFAALTEGDVETAVDTALSVAISQKMIDKEARLREQMIKLVSEKVGTKHYHYANYFRLLCKGASGYTPSELTAKGDGAFKYILSINHAKGAGAYIACMETILIGLKMGLDYHQIAAMLSVKTGKNTEWLLSEDD